MARSFRSLALIACLFCLPGSAWAQGHMLHGVGPVNSAMGGAGVALPNESIGALVFNPALIAASKGNQISFISEFFQDGIQIDTTLGIPPGQTFTGHVSAPSQLGVIPAFGWMSRNPEKKLAIGFGLLAIAGFGTDYPADQASILFAPAPNGFGRIYTDYRETKIPIAFAYQVNPKLAIGASLNLYLGEFAVAPLPYQFFDVDPSLNRYYPEAGKMRRAWAVAGQFGFYYEASPMVSIGASYTMPQNFQRYTWNSTIATPGSVDYGQPRTVSFDLDGPMIVAFGTGLKPSTKTSIAIDGMFTKYKGVHGFGGPGGIVNGIVDPFGWRNIWTFKAGIQHVASEKLTVRAGYNYSQMPLRSEVVLSATGAPATFQHHFCGGVGIKMFPFLEADASVYFVPRQHIVGPYPDLDNNVIGTIDESNKLTGFLIGLNFRF